MERITITRLIEQIPTEAAAYAFMEKMIWGDKPVCGRCGSINDHYYLKPENGVSRKTRTGNVSERRVWCCKDCRRQFSVTTGTIFHGSKVSLRTWLFVVFEMTANKNGIAAREIERKYGVAPKTAWHMAHRIREAMVARGGSLMNGIVIADETWIGPDPTKMNKKARAKHEKNFTDKQPVMSLISKKTGEVRSKPVNNVTGKTLRKVMTENVDRQGSILYTDQAPAYVAIGRTFTKHETVNHSIGQYMHHGATTNQAENYFSQLKRSLDGTHHHVSREHLPRYLSEFDFRYTTKALDDTERMARLMGQTPGRRLTYREISS